MPTGIYRHKRRHPLGLCTRCGNAGDRCKRFAYCAACHSESMRRFREARRALRGPAKKPGPPRESLIGRRFGRLVVVQAGPDVVLPSTSVPTWECRCDCGSAKVVRVNRLRSGETTSCGCYQKEQASKLNLWHGHNRRHKSSRTHNSWRAMIARCVNPKNIGYPEYGARGITVCARWRSSFANFLADMGERPAGMTLDRRDNDKGYSRRNCRWATPKQQANNTRRSKLNLLKLAEHDLAEAA